MVGTYTEGDEPIPGFRLTNLLGWGRFGEVWKATGPGGITVAIKIIPLSSRQGLKEFRAIRLVKQIRHPNLVPIMAFWLKDRQGNFIDDSLADDAESLHALASELLIVMGLGEKSLFDRLQECLHEGLPAIPIEELLGYMDDAARAIDFLNRRVHLVGSSSVGIQHCDIKPHNVLLVSGVAQICDLGVARVLEDARASAATGSAAYIAPEFIKNSKPSPTTDQYSFAVTYIELRTGCLPFHAKSAAAAYLVHLNGELDLSALSTHEREVLAKATALDPSERFSSCCEFVKELRQACDKIPPEERAVAIGVAYLNASGLVAGAKEESVASLHCFGPLSTAMLDLEGEHLALSEVVNVARFPDPNEKSCPLFELAEDNVMTADCRGKKVDETPKTVTLPRPAAPSQARLVTSWSTGMWRWLKWNPALAVRIWERWFLLRERCQKSWGSRNRLLRKWKSQWSGLQRLVPVQNRYLRYAGQIGVLLLLGVVAGLATTPFRAAEKTSEKGSSTPKAVTESSSAARPGQAWSSDSLSRAKELQTRGLYDEALLAVNDAIKSEPENKAGYAVRAQIETEMDRCPEALSDSQLALDKGYRGADLHASRARIYYLEGEYPQALIECQRALAIDQNCGDAQYTRSQVLMGQRKYDATPSSIRSAQHMVPRGRAAIPVTALAMGKNGVMAASSGLPGEPSSVRIWKNAQDSSPRTLNAGPALAVSPDGKQLVTTTKSNALSIVDLATNKEILSLPGHDSLINAVVFCKDGAWLASAGKDRSVKVWDASSGKLIYTLDGHQGSVTCLASSDKASVLVSAGADGTIRIWDLKDGSCRVNGQAHDGSVDALAFSPDGRLLASGGGDRMVKFWNPEGGTLVKTLLTGHSAGITCLAFSDDGKLLATGSADPAWRLREGQLRIWEEASGKCLATYGGQPNGVFSLAFDPTGKKIASAGTDWTLRWWNLDGVKNSVPVAKK